MSKSNFKVYMSSNIPKFRQYLNRIIANYDKYADTILEEICQNIVQEAQERLLFSGYDVDRLVNNIVYQKYGENKYRVGIKNNEDKDIMYFLEFGTGIVGRENKHPKANDIGWQYVVHPEKMVENKYSIGINALGEYVGYTGWYYYDEDGNKQFTSGLKPIRYFYDTIKKENIDKIVNRVLLKYRNME